MFHTIVEKKNVHDVLVSHNILKQYKKAKENILSGNPQKYFLKERKPKGSGILYFRINRKYRALGFADGKTLKIFKIDSHQ